MSREVTEEEYAVIKIMYRLDQGLLYGSDYGDKSCRSGRTNPVVILCTRPKGHHGPHVDCYHIATNTKTLKWEDYIWYDEEK